MSVDKNSKRIAYSINFGRRIPRVHKNLYATPPPPHNFLGNTRPAPAIVKLFVPQSRCFILCLAVVFLAPCAFSQDITAPEQLYRVLQGRGYLTLVVPDFLNSDGTVSALGRQLRDEAISYFTSSNPQIKVLERERLDAITAELTLQSSGSVREDDTIALGELLGADVVIIGALAKYNSSRIVFTTRIVDIRSGLVLSSGSTQIRGMRSVRLYDRKE